MEQKRDGFRARTKPTKESLPVTLTALICRRPYWEQNRIVPISTPALTLHSDLEICSCLKTKSWSLRLKAFCIHSLVITASLLGEQGVPGQCTHAPTHLLCLYWPEAPTILFLYPWSPVLLRRKVGYFIWLALYWLLLRKSQPRSKIVCPGKYSA